MTSVITDSFRSIVAVTMLFFVRPAAVARLFFDPDLGIFLLLLPRRGMLSRYITAQYHWSAGHVDRCIAEVECIIAILEPEAETVLRGKAVEPRSSMRRLLGRLYGLLAKAYLRSGDIDEAMSVISRANKSVGIKKLPALPGIDGKMAQIIRAGIAAGKLMEGGVSAIVTNGPFAGEQLKTVKDVPKRNRRNLRDRYPKVIVAKDPALYGKVIPFPIQPN